MANLLRGIANGHATHGNELDSTKVPFAVVMTVEDLSDDVKLLYGTAPAPLARFSLLSPR